MDKYQVFSEVYLGVDKVVIGIPFKPIVVDETLPPDALAEQKALRAAHWHEHLAWRQYVESTIVQQFKCQAPKPKQGEWLKRFLVYSDDPSSDPLSLDDGLLFTVRSGLTPKLIHVLNVEWNPSKLTASAWGEMAAYLSLLFFNHYEELYERGVVSHFEWFVDIPGVLWSELVLVELGRRTVTPYKSTTYAGRQGGKQVDTIYDKGGQLKLAGALTRVEARNNRRDLLFRDLVEKGIANPFHKSALVTNEAVQLIAQETSPWVSVQTLPSLKQPETVLSNPEMSLKEGGEGPGQAAGCWAWLMERNSVARASLRRRAASLSLMA